MWKLTNILRISIKVAKSHMEFSILFHLLEKCKKSSQHTLILFVFWRWGRMRSIFSLNPPCRLNLLSTRHNQCDDYKDLLIYVHNFYAVIVFCLASKAVFKINVDEIDYSLWDLDTFTVVMDLFDKVQVRSGNCIVVTNLNPKWIRYPCSGNHYRHFNTICEFTSKNCIKET